MRENRSFNELKEAVGLALDALRRNPLRSCLTILGIVIGVSTVIAISAVVNGLDSNVIGSIEAMGSNIIICYKFPWASMGRPTAELLQRKELKAEWTDGLGELPHVVAAGASARIFHPELGSGSSDVRRGDTRAKNVILQGNPPEIAKIYDFGLYRGRFFNQTDEDHRSPIVVLGYDTADTLFPGNEDPIGKEVLLEGRVFTVVGVLERQKQAFGNGKNPEDNIAIVPLTTMHKLHPEFKDYVLFVKATDAQYVPVVVDEVRDYLRRMRRLASDKPDDFAIFTPDAFIDLWKQISGGIFIVMFAVGSVALLVGGIGVMNIMLVSVTERTREIGVRKAVGARRADIVLQFLTEAVVLTALGGILGLFIGWVISMAARLAFSNLPTAVPLWAAAAGVIMSVGVGLFFGIWPAARAASLDPVEALRYE
ncbi:MAG TPA: ABC transporter permease [Candidatus Acidoferrum sp.]|nr:ABC transporter permease [Candidatus Acidoferrum sp.]